MTKIRIELHDIKEAIPVKNGYYLLVVVDDPIQETNKVVPSELCGGTFYKLEDLPGGVATGMVDMPETYDERDIIAWGRIPDTLYFL
jgi:hypothetical protein